MWNHLPRAIVAVAAFSAVTVDFSMPTDARDGAVGSSPAVEFVDMPAAVEAAAAWAMDLFGAAGFQLPPLRYVFHGDDPEPCAERPGLHHPVEGINVIEICTSEMSTVTEWMILHETAHAWLDHTLTDERKAAFQRLRGWTYWRNYAAADWHDNGTEQAAEIMVWGLIDRPIALLRLDSNACDELEAGYRVLTGQAPLHGFRDEC
jgi:hypothetical protein